MDRNELVTIAQRLREYVGNPHHVDPMSDAFKALIGDAANALSQSAKPQGEPVAWQYRVSAGPQTGWSLWHDGKGEEFKQSYQVETRPLYAEQPAPVAVPRLEMAHVVRAHMEITGCPVLTSNQCHALAMKLNACLDELRRLNIGAVPGVLITGRRPIPAGIESLAQQIYQSWESQPGFVPWIDGGNSAKQDEARQIASRTFELALANQVD